MTYAMVQIVVVTSTVHIRTYEYTCVCFQAILMLLTLLLAFIICWSPFIVALLYAEHRSQVFVSDE